MQQSRADYLVNKLISNTLSGPELEEFLAGMEHSSMLETYSGFLEAYFHQLIQQNGQATLDQLGEKHPPPQEQPTALPDK